MTRPEDPRGMLSRLPDDPRYWERLTDRVMEDVGPALASRRGAGAGGAPAASVARDAWWRPLARHARALAIGAAAAVIGTLALLPERPATGAGGGGVAFLPGTDPAFAGGGDVFSLVPADPVMTPLVLAEEPPTLAALLATPDQEREP